MADINLLPEIARQVRRDILRMVHAVNSGHPGGSLGCADYLTALYFHYMKHDPSNFTGHGNGEDVFVMSNGHISPVFYSVLARSGYFPTEELATFRKLNTRLQGHPTTHEGLPGVRVAWEAVMFAAHNKLDNILVAVDFNQQQIDGSTEDVMGITELVSKFRAFGWLTVEMDGNNWDEIHRILPQAQNQLGSGKPVVIIMKTEMGQGVDFMMGSHAWHGKAPNDEQLARAMAQLLETQFGDY